MQRLRREMDEVFDRTLPWRTLGVVPAYPAMNVWLSDESAVVTAELPGMDANSLEISVLGDTLTVSGNRPEEEVPEDAIYHRRERAYGSFSRAFTLPFQIEEQGVEATYENGVLQIKLPRSEQDKPRKITVRAL
jgi:HSP20 family protein